MPRTHPNLRQRMDRLYNGGTRTARFFRYGLLAFDVGTVAFFVVASFLEHATWYLVADMAIAAVMSADLLARLVIEEKRGRFFLRPLVIADLLVIATLLAPAFVENFAFLRLLRALRLLRSYHVLKDLRGQYAFFARNEEVIQSVVNLFVFIFFITALVYVLQVRTNPAIGSYVDALYFTVATLTTTGFGDVTLQGDVGRVLSVVIMVFGVALFLRLVQTIFRPQKVRYRCPDCGLERHEPDAVHCKHCGRVLAIGSDGETGTL